VNAAGSMRRPGGDSERSTHADAARRAVAALRAAKVAGDQAAANRHARRLQRALDAHLIELRSSRRLS
jgi:hypothetical protein